MRMGTTALAMCALACFGAPSAVAQGGSMTLADVLTRAREQASQIVSARLALDETRARWIGASVKLQNNPQLDAWVGNRNGPTDRFTDFQFGLTQGFAPSQFLTYSFFFPEGYGVGMAGTYAVWLLVVAMLYPLCRWVAAVKDRRRDWWLSYL